MHVVCVCVCAFTLIRFGSQGTFNRPLPVENVEFKLSFKYNFQHFDERVANSKMALFLNANLTH